MKCIIDNECTKYFIFHRKNTRSPYIHYVISLNIQISIILKHPLRSDPIIRLMEWIWQYQT